MPLEKEIVNQIIRWLKTIPNCEVRKLHGSVYSTKGDPDIYGCIDGRMFQIECKQPGKNPRPIQTKRLKDWRKAGAASGVARNLKDAQEIVAPLLDLPDSRT